MQRLPAGFALELLARQRIAPVMPGPVRHIFDQAGRSAGDRQYLLHHGLVGQGAIAADVINLAVAPLAEQSENRLAVIFHIQPVPDLHSVAIHRKRLSVEGVGDHQRDQLLGKLAGSVVVGGARDDHRQLVGPVIAQRQKIGAGFARRIRTAGLQRKLLVGFQRRVQTAVHFVGGNMNEALHAMRAHGLQQIEGAPQIGFKHGLRRENAAVHVGLGGEMH